MSGGDGASPQEAQSAAPTLGTLAATALRPLITNYAARLAEVHSGDDPDALRRVRVAVRRLRAALRFFAPVLPSAADQRQSELRHVAAAAGDVRDLDLLLARIVRGQSAEGDAALPERADLSALLRQRREAALQRFTEALDAPSGALLLGWLAALPAAAASGDRPRARRPAGRAAPALLRPLYQRVRRLGDTLDEESPPERWHLLRIGAKRLRYALELTDRLYSAPAQRLRRRLAALQDLLGEHQDAAVAAAQLNALRQSEPAAQPAALQTLLASLVRQAEDDAAALRPRFAAAYARLRSPWKTLARTMKRQRRVAPAAAGPQAAAQRAGSPRRKPTVELYLVRHAIAGESDPMAWPDDRERPLTPEGAKRFRQAAAGLRIAAPEVERVLTSPLTRAVQTAEMLRKRAHWPAAQPLEELAGGSTPEQIVEALRAHAGAASLALVGHEPGLHDLAAYLLTGGQTAALLEFKKGGVACLSFGGEIQPGTASLRWLLTPKLLRALAKG